MMLRQLILSIRSRFPTGNMLVVGIVTITSVGIVSGATAYQRTSRANQVDIADVKPADTPKISTPVPEEKPGAAAPLPEPEEVTQPTRTTPKPVTPKPTQAPPSPARSTTAASIVVGGLVVGASSSTGGMCSIPVSTSVTTNFSGSVTLYFSTYNAALGQNDSSARYVTVSPGVAIPVQHSLSFITPGTYPVNVTLSVGASSFSPAYTGPTISYGGGTTGAATCENY